MEFGVEIHLTMLYLKIDRSKSCCPLCDLDGRDLFSYLGHTSVNKWSMH